MRKLIGEEKPPRDIWDMKLIPGGLIDLEFVAQVAGLTGNVDGDRAVGTSDTLARLSDGFASAQIRQELVDAHALYMTLSQIMRLCLTGAFDADDAPPGLLDLILRSVDLPQIGVLEAHVEETAARVRTHFEALIGKAG